MHHLIVGYDHSMMLFSGLIFGENVWNEFKLESNANLVVVDSIKLAKIFNKQTRKGEGMCKTTVFEEFCWRRFHTGLPMD